MARRKRRRAKSRGRVFDVDVRAEFVSEVSLPADLSEVGRESLLRKRATAGLFGRWKIGWNRDCHFSGRGPFGAALQC